jgi:ferritin-like metal-binding protein YciE
MTGVHPMARNLSIPYVCGRCSCICGHQTHPNDLPMKTLRNLFLDELADMYDAENRILRALPKMAKAATNSGLQAAIRSHEKETKGQITKLKAVFAAFGEKAKSKKCEATVGLLEEGEEIAEEFKDSPAINAALICALQKVEHYEIATYGCLCEWADLLENPKATDLLQRILDQEGAANRALTELARTSSNPAALVAEQPASRKSRNRKKSTA